MRSVSLVLGSLFALAACGDDADGPTACEVGPEIVSAATSSVRSEQFTCARDEECVLINLDVECAGYSTVGCGDIIHRDAAARWDADEVCRDIDRASVPSPLHCSLQASCVDVGRPVCRRGQCVGDKLL